MKGDLDLVGPKLVQIRRSSRFETRMQNEVQALGVGCAGEGPTALGLFSFLANPPRL